MRSLYRLILFVALITAFTHFTKLAEAKPSKDVGLLFQDEVSQEIIVDTKSVGHQAEHAFSDLQGRLKPGTKEYQALVHVIEQEVTADKNIEVPSLTELRTKYDQAFQRLSMVSESAPKPTETSVPPVKVTENSVQNSVQNSAEPRVPASLELQFAEIPEAGYTNPSLKGYRLIPLETGAMLVSESGDKRVFGFQDTKEGDDFEFSVGEIVETGSLLALRRKDSVWIIHLSRSKSDEPLKIDWSKRLEFPFSEVDSPGSQVLKVTAQDQTIAVEGGLVVMRLASTNGRLLANSVKTAAKSADDLNAEPSVAKEPTREPASDPSIVQPIED